MEGTNVMSMSEVKYLNVANRLANSEVGYGFESVEPSLESVIEVEGRVIRLIHGAELPTSICAKSGKPAVRLISKRMRDPLNPLTWFGKRPEVKIGLCRKEYENRLVAISSTWAVFGLGIFLLAMGILNIEIPFIMLGSVMVLISGVFRARVPIWTDLIADDEISVLGTGEAFRDLLESKRFAVKIERE